MRVLLVEYDDDTAEGTSGTLRSIGYSVDHVSTGGEAVEMLRRYDYDLALLEMVLPDMAGYEVVRTIRAARIDTPAMVLSSLVRPQAKVKAFSAGADDYVTKPYDPTELAARVQAVVRRSKGYCEPTLRAGRLKLCLDSREVSVDGRPVHLTGKEYLILQLLLLRKGMVLTKDAFLNHLYGGMDEPEMKIIDVFICKLRKKLHQAGVDNLITTVWGQGYMLKEDALPRPAVPKPVAVPTASPAPSLGAL
ncbi:response regulator transcription factor [Gluconacetobacter azotocaptans]|uniref:Response regulator transcription factor n=1 Tax=Gluconacetobacter azotocaptans TaxID=142834 RepID=A0A7W4PDX7_9PROT|nr:response regulator transcription factor [Gluconacetobacter azotocaptans]MBB2190125.1 response regulator transcription factor [Gluconacetobacter azotocaptans]MBM9402896.1 response regulator transcription factor [Gluconacetobacter azotocaptans]